MEPRAAFALLGIAFTSPVARGSSISQGSKMPLTTSRRIPSCFRSLMWSSTTDSLSPCSHLRPVDGSGAHQPVSTDHPWPIGDWRVPLYSQGIYAVVPQLLCLI